MKRLIAHTRAMIRPAPPEIGHDPVGGIYPTVAPGVVGRQTT